MMRVLTILIALVMLPTAALAQEIVTDLSQQEVELTHSFRGQDLFLYGAIKNDTGAAGRYDIVVTISGEERSQVVMKKQRVFGFWVNANSRTLEDVPEFFGQASTRPLKDIASPDTLKRLGLGIGELGFVKSLTAEGPDGLGYAEGLIKVKSDRRLYQTGTKDMSVVSDVLFRADFFFPPRVPSGTYTARAYLFQDGKLIGRSSHEITVEQVGFERMVYNLAHQHPAIYGLLAVVLALFAGWLAGFLTRSRSKLG